MSQLNPNTLSGLNLTLHEIKELMDKLAVTNLGSLYLKNGEFELRLDAKQPAYSVMPLAAEAPAFAVPAQAATAKAAPVSAEQPALPDGKVVKSPIVGTFYSSSAPDNPAYVTVGSRVKKGDVLFLIESMKLMNEIQSEFDGEVVEILLDNAQGVEYGQPIMIIK